MSPEQEALIEGVRAGLERILKGETIFYAYEGVHLRSATNEIARALDLPTDSIRVRHEHGTLIIEIPERLPIIEVGYTIEPL